MVLLATFILHEAGMQTIAALLAMEKWYLFLQILIGNYGRVLLHVKITAITLFTTTGIGSGTGAPANPVITEHMKLIACDGLLALIILIKWFPEVVVMHLTMTGKRQIRR